MFSSITKNRPLMIALAISLLFHGALLATRFVANGAHKLTPTNPGLEVILVNARHDSKPVKAQALAQADLDGGGDAKDGHAKSPLPDMKKSHEGDSLQSHSGTTETLEQERQRLLLAINKNAKLTAKPRNDVVSPPTERHVNDPLPPSTEMARKEAEIAKMIEDINKAPRKTYISPSTLGVGYALYYKQMQERIETVGTNHFPRSGNRKLYGKLVVTIPVFQDGSIYMHDGGIHVDRSSGNPELDAAALRIVMQAAPFGSFPKNMRSGDRTDVWEIIATFDFSKNNELNTRVFSTAQ